MDEVDKGRNRMDVHSYVDGFIRRKRIRLKACEERRERALAAAKEAAAFWLMRAQPG